VIEIDPRTDIAERARERRSQIAQKTFRSKTPGAERTDVVMYLVGAIDKLAAMSKQDVKKTGFEVVTLGMKGFDVNDSTQKIPAPHPPGTL
jgi:hypothetical protein